MFWWQKRWTKIPLIVLGVLVLLVLALPLWFPTGFLRGRIIQAIEEKSGRKAEIGSVRLHLFPTAGARIRNLVIHAAAPDAPAPFLQVPSIDATVSLWPLLRGKLRLDCTVDEPRIAILPTIKKVSGPAGEPPPGVEPQPGAGTPDAEAEAKKDDSGTLEALTLTVRRGSVGFVDQETGKVVRSFVDLSLDVTKASADRPFVFSGQAAGTETAEAQPGQVRLTGELAANQAPADVKGKIELEWSDLRLEAFELALREFLPYHARAKDFSGRVTIQLDGLENVTLQAKADATNLQLTDRTTGEKQTDLAEVHLESKALLDLKRRTIAHSTTTVSTTGAEAGLDASVEKGETGQVWRFEAKVAMTWDELSPQIRGLLHGRELRGETQLEVKAEGPIGRLTIAPEIETKGLVLTQAAEEKQWVLPDFTVGGELRQREDGLAGELTATSVDRATNARTALTIALAGQAPPKISGDLDLRIVTPFLPAGVAEDYAPGGRLTIEEMIGSRTDDEMHLKVTAGWLDARIGGSILPTKRVRFRLALVQSGQAVKTLRLTQATADAGVLAADLSGSSFQWTGEQPPVLHLKGTATVPELREFLLALPDVLRKKVPKELYAARVATAAFQVGGTSEAPKLSAALDLTGAVLAYGEHFQKPLGVVCRAEANGVEKQDQAWTLPQLELSLGETVLRGSAALTSEPKAFDAQFRSDVDLAKLAKYLPALAERSARGTLRMAAPLTLQFADGKLTFNGRLALKSVSALVNPKRSRDRAELNGEIALDPTAIEWRLAGTLPGNRLETIGRVSGYPQWPKSSLRVRVRAEELTVERFLALMPTKKPAGGRRTRAAVPPAPPAARGPYTGAGPKAEGAPTWQALSARLDVKVKRLTYARQVLEDIVGQADLNGGKLVTELTGKLGGGDLQFQGQSDLAGKAARHAYRAQVREAKVSEGASRGWMLFAVPFLGQAESTLRGVMTMDLAVEGQGLETEALLGSLKGNGKIEMAKGTTVSLGWLAHPFGGAALEGMLRMLPIGDALRELSLERTLDGLKGEFLIQDGAIGTKMTLADPRAVIVLDGKTRLTGRGVYPIQYQVAIQSTPQSHRALRQIAEAFGGQVTLPLTIGGTLRHPKAKLKLDRLLKDFNPLRLKEKGGLPGLLEGLLRRKSKKDRRPPPETPPGKPDEKRPPLRFEDIF